MQFRFFFCLSVLAACSAGQIRLPDVPDPAVQSRPAHRPTVRPRVEVIHSVQLNGVVAEFMGERVPAGISERYGVVGLRFVFEDGRKVSFKPSGTLYFSDWRFDIASPDSRHILLLQDRYGPYHVVRVDRLSAYLADGKPDAEFGYANPEGSAWVHQSGRWTAADRVVYRAGLTSLADFEFVLP